MTELKLTGGARIGMKKASYPFVTLTVSKGVLELDAGLIGKLAFLPGDITSIGTYSMPGFGKEAIIIYHNVTGYNEKVIFQSLKFSGYDIREMIGATGLMDKNAPQNPNITQREKEVRQLQASGSFPIKKPFAIAFIVIWNVLFLSSLLLGFLGSSLVKTIPLAALPALGFVALVSLLLLVSGDFARLVLKEGRSVKDIRKFLFFILFITAFMMANMYFVMNMASR